MTVSCVKDETVDGRFLPFSLLFVRCCSCGSCSALRLNRSTTHYTSTKMQSYTKLLLVAACMAIMACIASTGGQQHQHNRRMSIAWMACDCRDRVCTVLTTVPCSLARVHRFLFSPIATPPLFAAALSFSCSRWCVYGSFRGYSFLACC